MCQSHPVIYLPLSETNGQSINKSKSLLATPRFLDGMLGVRSSSLLDSILKNAVLNRIFSGHLTAFKTYFLFTVDLKQSEAKSIRWCPIDTG